MSIKRETNGLTDSETVKNITQNFQDAFKEMQSFQKAYQDFIKKITDLNKQLFQNTKNENPYELTLKEIEKEQSALDSEVKSYSDSKKRRLEIDKWYMQESKKIKNDKNLTDQEKTKTLESLDKLYDKRSEAATFGLFEEGLYDVKDIVGKGLSDMLTEFDDFDGNLRKMAKNLYSYLIQTSTEALMQQILSVENMSKIASSFMGIFGKAKSGVTGFFGKLFKGKKIFHSGGILPVGANAELPGTKEQLALLKGGERVLSPAENTDYKSSSGASPVVFNNFNVQAWDSKDVQQYLIENKQLLNTITYEGIKNNKSQLRTIVQNA